jgi:hypothetical protein
LFAYGIFKVIHSPFKAFKEIIEKPKYTGPILIMILFVLASIGSEYAKDSKLYVQQTLPSTLDPYNPDPWTENCTMWISNAEITYNSDDCLLGHNSIQFSITNNDAIWMELKNIGEINCLSTDGYKNLSFCIKWINPTADPPQNASLYLFSMGTAGHFCYDLAERINQTENDKWNNFTVPVGLDAEQWVSSSAQTVWNSITGLKIELVWAQSIGSNLTILVDKVYFQSANFEPLINSMGSTIVARSAFNAVTTFSIYWMLSGIAVFIVGKLFRIKAEFKVFLIIVGYALIAMVVMQVLFNILYLLISPLYITIDAISPTSVLQTIILFTSSIVLLLPVWSIIISSIGVHTASDLPLSKSAVIAIIGFLPYYVLLFIA